MGRASSPAAPPAASAPIRRGRSYGAVTAAAPLSGDPSLDHMGAYEQGYSSLPSRADGLPSGEGGGLARVLRRVVAGAVAITLLAVAVSTLYGGKASSEAGVSGDLYPKMAAEVSCRGVLPVQWCFVFFQLAFPSHPMPSALSVCFTRSPWLTLSPHSSAFTWHAVCGLSSERDSCLCCSPSHPRGHKACLDLQCRQFLKRCRVCIYNM